MSGASDDARARGRISDALGDLRRITSSQRLERRVAAHAGVPLGMAAFSVLSAVVAEGPMRLSDLAAAQRMLPAALTRQVQSLEAEGYLERRTDPDDRRASVVKVTASGRAAHRRVRAANDAIMAEQLAGWSPAELTELADTLDRLVVDLRTPVRADGRRAEAG